MSLLIHFKYSSKSMHNLCYILQTIIFYRFFSKIVSVLNKHCDDQIQKIQCGISLLTFTIQSIFPALKMALNPIFLLLHLVLKCIFLSICVLDVFLTDSGAFRK